MKATDLPRPACALGYTSVQLLAMLGPDRFAELTRRLRVQTVKCDEGAGCGAHGVVIPERELRAFLARR